MKPIIKNSGPKAVTKASKSVQPPVSAPANHKVTLPPAEITPPVRDTRSAIQREADRIRVELEAGVTLSDAPAATPKKLGLEIPLTKREFPKLSGRSRYILDQIAIGEIEEFLGDDWAMALAEAASEAVDVANVSEGRLSLAERVSISRVQHELFMKTWTAEDQAEMDSSSRAHEIECAKIKLVEFLTYKRVGYKGGAYVLRIIRREDVHEVVTYCPTTTGLNLDREAILDAYRRISTLHRAPGFVQEEAETWAKGLSSQRRLHKASPTQERIRTGLLTAVSEQGAPLRCTMDHRSLSSMRKCQDLAMRSFWMRRSNY